MEQNTKTISKIYSILDVLKSEHLEFESTTYFDQPMLKIDITKHFFCINLDPWEFPPV